MAETDLSPTMRVLSWRGRPQPVSPFAAMALEQWDAGRSFNERSDAAILVRIDGVELTVPAGADARIVERLLKAVRALPPR